MLITDKIGDIKKRIKGAVKENNIDEALEAVDDLVYMYGEMVAFSHIYENVLREKLGEGYIKEMVTLFGKSWLDVEIELEKHKAKFFSGYKFENPETNKYYKEYLEKGEPSKFIQELKEMGF